MTKENKDRIKKAKQNKEKIDAAMAREEIVQYCMKIAERAYDVMVEQIRLSSASVDASERTVREMSKAVILRSIDTAWVDHLVTIDHLRTGIGLRGYGQRDPLIEYKKETFFLFQELQQTIRHEVVSTFFKVHAGLQLAPSIMATDTLTLQGAKNTEEAAHTHAVGETNTKIGRNDPCYCGSGKKFKKCHGK
jgi:preprotein translocase subunit SecA